MSDYFEPTLRLYQRINDQLKFVWVYAHNEYIHTDRGTAGEFADRSRVPTKRKPEVDAMIANLLGEGYTEIDTDKMHYLDIEFPIEGEFANQDEFDHREILYNEIDEFLALTGLGWMSGSSNGMGTMELGTAVVDFEIAKKALHQWFLEKGYKYGRFVELSD